MVLFGGIVAGLYACNDRHLSKEDLKSNFVHTGRPSTRVHYLNAARADSMPVLAQPRDSLRWTDRQGVHQAMRLTDSQQVHISYSEKIGFWERGLHSAFRPDQIYVRNDTVFSTLPVRAGFFQQERKPFIPLEAVSEIKIKDITNVDNRLSLLTEAFAPFDAYGGPSFRLGIECKIIRNLAAYLEAGNYFSWYPYGNESALRGTILLPEIKYYLNPNGYSTGRYIALQYAYKDQTNNLSDTVSVMEKSVFVRQVKQYELYKIVQSISLKYGTFLIRRKGFTVDFFAGAGVDFRNAHSSLSEQEQNSIVRPGDYSLVYSRFAVGKVVSPTVTFGIKVGWHVW